MLMRNKRNLKNIYFIVLNASDTQPIDSKASAGGSSISMKYHTRFLFLVGKKCLVKNKRLSNYLITPIN